MHIESRQSCRLEEPVELYLTDDGRLIICDAIGAKVEAASALYFLEKLCELCDMDMGMVECKDRRMRLETA